MSKKDYYQILGISPTASLKEIKSSFRVLAKKHHPDKVGHITGQFEVIMEAYKVLSNANKRARYDAELSLKSIDLLNTVTARDQAKKRFNKNDSTINKIKQSFKWEDQDSKFHSIFIAGVYAVLILLTIYLVG